MRLEFTQPKNETEFVNFIRDLTNDCIFWERVEPANESGFPDSHFVIYTRGGDLKPEGTVEFKHFKPREKVDLRSAKTRGNQSTSLIEYFKYGGRRRFFMAYHNCTVYLWDTASAYSALLGKSSSPKTFLISEECEKAMIELRNWLRENLS